MGVVVLRCRNDAKVPILTALALVDISRCSGESLGVMSHALKVLPEIRDGLCLRRA